MVSRRDKETIREALLEKALRKSRGDFKSFAKLLNPNLLMTNFHHVYYDVLNLFAHGSIKRLIVSVPPQHGKSEGSTRLLPSFIVGLNRNVRLGIGSYNHTFAKKFGRQIKSYLRSEDYISIFGGVLPSVKGGKINASEEFELDGGCGFVKLFSRGSGITGNSLDVTILDDIYKDRAEALSPVIRSSAIEWYTSAVNTRYHNDSQELIVFTRWHEEDLIGFLSTKKKFIYPKTFEELHHHIDDDAYFVINYEAIKTGEKTELDPREVGEPLFPERHSLKRLLEAKDYDEEVFQSLYQGDPKPKKGMLYSGFLTYASLPTGSRYCYVDVADGGGDYLCAVCGVKSASKFFVTDVYYSKDKMEVTELKTAKMIRENSVGKTFVESNSGGRGFARQLEKLVNPENSITWFHQSGNKESRILSNATAVKNSIIFPQDWKIRFPDFYKHLHEFRSEYKSNSHDDAPDAITGIIEKIMSGTDLAFKESSVFI